MRQLIAVVLFCAGLFCIAQAQVPMTGAGLGAPSGGGGFTPSCSQSSTFLAAATGVVLTADKTNYDTLICGLVTDGNFAGLDVLYIWAAPTQTNAALINLANPGTFNGTTHGTVSFSAYNGYTGDGSTFYIDTGFNASTAPSPNFTQNLAAYGIYDLSTHTPTNQWIIGAVSGPNSYFEPYSGGSFSSNITSASSSASNTSTNTQGAWVAVRNTSASTHVFINSNETALGNATDASQAPANSNMIFFGFNTGFGNTSDQLAAGWIGKGFTVTGGTTATVACQINNRINTYMASLASPINVYTNSAC